MIKTILLAISLALAPIGAFAVPVNQPNQTDDFAQFVNGQPSGITPYAATDYFVLIQNGMGVNGLTKKVPANTIVTTTSVGNIPATALVTGTNANPGTISCPTITTTTQGLVTNVVAGTCGSGGGTGNVVGPLSSTTGDLASFNGPTGGIIQDTGIQTNNVVQLAATQTLTNKNIVSPTIISPSIATITNGTAVLTLPQVTGTLIESTGVNIINGSLNVGTFLSGGIGQTFPASGLIVGTTDTQTLTNKTISPASNSLLLANTHILVGNSSGFATDVPVSGSCTIFNTGGLLCPLAGTALQLFSVSGNTTKLGTTTGTLIAGHTVSIDANGNFVDSGGTGGGSGSVVSVALSVPGPGVFSVTGSPITTSGTINVLTTGNSGGIPYFGSSSVLASSALLAANGPVIGGGAGAAPTTVTPVVNAVLVTNGTGVPSESATLPTGLTIPGYVPTTRLVNTNAPITGGGNLSSNLTLALVGPSNLTTFITNAIPKGASTSPFIASALSDNATFVISTETLDIQTNALTIEIPNDTVTGTTFNKLAKLNGASPSQVITASIADTTGVIVGIVAGGTGTTGVAQIAISGIQSCVFDGATTAGHFVQVSTSIAGDCHDSGSATLPSAGGQVIGRVFSSNGAGGTYSMDLWTASTLGGTSGGGGSVSVTAGTPNILVVPSPGTGTFTVGTTDAQNTQAGSAYTVAASDGGSVILRTNGSATNDIVPQATGTFGAGFGFDILTTGAGDNVTSTTSTINGIAGAIGVKLGIHQDTSWMSDGSNWQVAYAVPQPPTQNHTTVLFDDFTWGVGGGGGLAVLPFYMGGCGLTNDAATPNTIIDIAACTTASDDSTTMMVSTALTKSTGAWVLGGSGNGCLDVGTVGNNLWYSVFEIERIDTNVVDQLCSLAAGNAAVVTITIATPGVVSTTNPHGYQVGTPVVFTSTGTLPTGIVSGTTYFVIAGGLTSTAFEIAATQGGTAINTTGSQSGTQTVTASPVMPANYTKKRRLGSIKTNGSAQIIAFKQYGTKFKWATSVLDMSAVSITSTASLNVLASVPPGVNVRPICHYAMSGTSPTSVILTDPSQVDVAPGVVTPFVSSPGYSAIEESLTAGVVNSTCPDINTDVAQNIRIRSGANAATFYEITDGWQE